MREHRREDLMTKIAAAEFDPEAACPLFDAFLEEVQPGPGDARLPGHLGGL
jgi:putative DNA primase/helicase